MLNTKKRKIAAVVVIAVCITLAAAGLVIYTASFIKQRNEAQRQWKAMSCTVDGIDYTLPFPMSELLDNGWEMMPMNQEFTLETLFDPGYHSMTIQVNNPPPVEAGACKSPC